VFPQIAADSPYAFRYAKLGNTSSSSFSACSRRQFAATKLLREDRGGGLNIKKQIPNIDVVRSAWRRVKKELKDAIIRDLAPSKDVKGAGVKGKSSTGGTDTPGSQKNG
jgi:hypothetical protein